MSKVTITKASSPTIPTSFSPLVTLNIHTREKVSIEPVRTMLMRNNPHRKDIPLDSCLQLLNLGCISHIARIRLPHHCPRRRNRWRGALLLKTKTSVFVFFDLDLEKQMEPTRPNQSDISDRFEKSLTNSLKMACAS